jgi:hypothetical protein
MAGGAIVGALKYLVEVDAAAAEAEIDKFMAEAKAKVEAAGGDATFRLLAESAQLERKLAEADAEIDRLKAKKAEVKLGADTSELDRAITAAEAELRTLGRQRAEIKVKTTGAVQALSELKALEAVQGDLSRRTSSATKSQNDQAVAVAKLRENYNKLASEVKRFESIRPASRRTEGQNLTLARMRSEMRSMEQEGRGLDRELGRLGPNLHTITQDVEGGIPAWRRWGQSISQAHINLGPFSTTVKGLGVAMVGLGPILMGLVGSASALAGAVGAGLVGAFGVAAGAMAGLGLAAIGAGIALHQPIHQLEVAHKATSAYADAVQKYGKDSSQAKDKQAQMNSALKGLPPQARAAVTTLGQMRVEFMKLGGNAIRGDFFSSFAQGIKTAHALLPAFARGSRDAFHAASQGFNQWMTGMRSPEAQHILSNIMGNFTKDIGPAMAGLGSLGTAFARFISIASGSGPGIASTFQSWAQGIENATSKGSGFEAKVQSLVDKAKSLGRFLSATGRLAGAFFGAGADSGQRMLDTMTKAENRWTSWMRSVAGQNSLRQFFGDSVNNTTALFHALAPLARTFTALSAALMPLTTGILQGASYIGKLVQAASSIPGMLPLIHGLGVAIAAAFVTTKIAGWLGLIKKAGQFLGIVAAETTAESAATDANTAALEANTAAMEANAAAAGANAEAHVAEGAAMEESALAGGAAMEGETAAAGGLAAGLGPVGIVLGTIVAGGLALNAVFGDSGNRWQPAIDASHAFNAAAKEIPTTQAKVRSSIDASNKAWDQVDKLTKSGKTGTQAYTNAVRSAAKAEAAHTQAQSRSRFEMNKAHTSVQTLSTQYDKAKQAVTDYVNKGLRPGDPILDTAITTMTSLGGSLRLATLNWNRLKEGAQAAGPEMLKSLASIKSIAGRQTALKFRFSDQNVTSGVARLSQSLTGLGRKQAVISILANSKNAEQAFANLRRLENNIKPKTVKVDANDDASPKIQKIQAKIQALKDKSLKMAVNDGASPALSRIQNEINALHDKVINIHANYSSSGTLGNGSPHGAASRANYAGAVQYAANGGMTHAGLDRAFALAMARTPLDAQRGRKMTMPGYIAGEEAPKYNEYIITENPAFRKSNLAFLAEAAHSLGAALALPRFGSGGKKKGKKKKGNPATDGPAYDPEGPTLSDKTGPPSLYNDAEQQVQRDAALVDIAKRRLDANPLLGVSSVTSLIDNEIGDYGALAQAIRNLGIKDSKGGAQPMMRPVPAVSPAPPDALKKKNKEKYQRLLKQHNDSQAAHDAAIAWNDSIRSGYSDLSNELWTIENITLPNLALDKDDINKGAQEALAAQNSSFNTVSMDIFRNLTSNISAIAGGSFGGVMAGISASSVNANPVGTTIMASGGTGTVASNNIPSSPTNGVNITNNFAGPPADPFTWTQQQAFEIQAA